MVHVFSSLGCDFALDTESGALLMLDKAAKRAIEKKLSPIDKDISTGDFFGLDELNAASAELQSLIDDGVMFCKDAEKQQTHYEGVVKSMCLNISHNCNLRCKYCFADGGSYSTKRANMPLNVAKSAIDFLINHSGNRKMLEVDFFGGEPLLNLDVVKKTVDYAKEAAKARGKDIRFTLTTNAVDLDKDTAEYLNKTMHNVVISIDGRESVHNYVRPDAQGNSTFNKSVQNAKHFRSIRGNAFYYIRGTFTAHNTDFCADALALNDLGFDQISLEPVVLPSDHPLSLKEKHLDALCEQYEMLGQEYLSRRKGDKWFNFFHFMLDLEGGPCLKKRITGCGAGSEYLAVSIDGGIYPCHRFDGQSEYCMGSVLDGSLNTEIAKRFAESNVYAKDGCSDCFCKYYCSGGCAANSIEHAGDINGRYKIGCTLMKKRTEVALAVAALESLK